MINEIEFDFEVISLIQDLSLVLAVSPQGQQWWTCWLQSRFSRYPLCERYKAYNAEIDAENHRLMVRLAKKNMKYSRFDIDNDYGIQQKIFE